MQASLTVAAAKETARVWRGLEEIEAA